MRPDSRIFVAGHRGLVGSALVRRLDMRNLWIVTELHMKNEGLLPSQKLLCALARWTTGKAF